MKCTKVLSLLLALSLLMGLLALPAAAESKSYYIGYSTLTTQGDFMALLANVFTERFTAMGHKFEVASADLNPAKQIEQIENFITLGVDALIVMAVEPSSLDDVLKRAQEAGVKVVAFSQPTGYYDLFLGADNYANGKVEAEMTAEWIAPTPRLRAWKWPSLKTATSPPLPSVRTASRKSPRCAPRPRSSPWSLLTPPTRAGRPLRKTCC